MPAGDIERHRVSQRASQITELRIRGVSPCVSQCVGAIGKHVERKRGVYHFAIAIGLRLVRPACVRLWLPAAPAGLRPAFWAPRFLETPIPMRSR